MTEIAILSVLRNRAAVVAELRRLLPGRQGWHKTLPFGLAALDSHLPDGGLACGALHEVVPETEGARFQGNRSQGNMTAAFGFIVAILGRAILDRQSWAHPLIFVMPTYGQRQHGRLCGHGLNGLGLDPARLILVETAHRKETLWAMAEALRSGAPQAVAGMIDKLDLKTSQKLHLAASDCGLPLLLLRPAHTLEASAAATRWRVGTAEAARDRFGLYARLRWHLRLERCRNGRPGQWVVEYDHVAHRFSLAAALADPALSRGAGDHFRRQAPIHSMGGS
jgi:protein ImuA